MPSAQNEFLHLGPGLIPSDLLWDPCPSVVPLSTVFVSPLSALAPFPQPVSMLTLLQTAPLLWLPPHFLPLPIPAF